jgi:tripartite-type tricarboxylate transporter receptor subunit TctC
MMGSGRNVDASKRHAAVGIDGEAMADPAVKEKLAAQGAALAGDSPEHFRAFIAAEIKRWTGAIRAPGVETTR